MKSSVNIWSIVKKYPLLLSINVIVMTLLGFMEMLAVLSISPIMDLILFKGMEKPTAVTEKITSIMQAVSLEASIINILVLYIVVNLFLTLVSATSIFLVIRTKYIVMKDLLISLFEAIFNSKWDYFSGKDHGLLMNTFNRELMIIGESMGVIGNLFANFFRLVFFAVTPFIISWKISGIVFILGALFTLPLAMLGNLNFKLGEVAKKTANKYTGIIYESLGAAKLILGFGNQEKVTNSLKNAFEKHADAAVRFRTIYGVTSQSYIPLGQIAIILVIAFAVEKHSFKITEITLITYSFLRMVPIIGSVIASRNSLFNFFPSFEQVYSTLESARENSKKSGDTIFTGFNDCIEMRKLNYCYTPNKRALNDIDVRIKKGSMTAFVGKSGAGKTTLVDMLLGLVDPGSGEILIDGKPFSSLDIYSYRKRVGYVPQDCVLFDATIKANVLWSDSNCKIEDVIEACKHANAHEFIEKMHYGYDTVVGNRGTKLSGGQRQRIALARAILRKPELLILDEATSNLDSQSEIYIQQSIEKLKKYTTIVIIAHRLSTIRNADWIYLLDEGEVVEQGTYEELVKLEGKFKSFIHHQINA